MLVRVYLPVYESLSTNIRKEDNINFTLALPDDPYIIISRTIMFTVSFNGPLGRRRRLRYELRMADINVCAFGLSGAIRIASNICWTPKSVSVYRAIANTSPQ